MSVCLSMSTVASSSRSSSTSVIFFQNPRATAKNSPFLLRATKKKPSPFIPSTTQPLNQTKKPHFENLRIRAAADGVSAVDEAQEDWASTASQDESEYAQDESEYDESEYAQDESEYEETEKLGVFVGQKDKPRLVLKFIWLEKNIGLALNQVIPGYGTIPLSPYYFWPRKDAWEELKTTLESKPWISQKRMIILLNQATDIINLWQQSGGNL